MIRVPEEVAGGGVDDLGAVAGLDGEVVDVGVVVDEDGGDGRSSYEVRGTRTQPDEAIPPGRAEPVYTPLSTEPATAKL